MEASSIVRIIDSWTTCHSFIQRKHLPNHSAVNNRIPPSKWDDDDLIEYCFLRRNITEDPSKYSTYAPGTALFQHWLFEYEKYGENASKSNDLPSWNPWNEFPTSEIMTQYPDVGDENYMAMDNRGTSFSARDYYTLWYTTSLSALTSSSEHTHSTESSSIKSVNSNHTANIRRRRGFLTLHGVNYRPAVYYNGELMNPYSTYDGNEEIHVDVGGMFIRRHYDLGISKDDTNAELPLEILVLPPPIVGKPALDKFVPYFDTILNEHTRTSRTMEEVESSQKQRRRSNEPQGQGGDHNIAQSGPIMQCTAGWDWIQPTPDRNTGIWDRVQIEWILGDIRLHDVWVRLRKVSVIIENESFSSIDSATVEEILPLGDDVRVSALIDLSVTSTHHGRAPEGHIEPIVGMFRYEIKRYFHPEIRRNSKPDQLQLDENSTILAHGIVHNITIRHSLSTHDLGIIRLENAQLWWPHALGSHPLYCVTVVFSSYDSLRDGGNMSDEPQHPNHESQAQTTFGIRTVSSYTHPKTKSFTLRVNGHSMFLVGGNWITTDQFLRFSTSDRRYFQELLLLKNAGFNSIRVWGGGITESDYFYNAADALGLLVYQEFWMTGDNNGNMAGSYDWPLDHQSYLLNAQDVVIRLRNHPSLAWYGGGNELFPIPSKTNSSVKSEQSDFGTSPPQDIDFRLRSLIENNDGSRSYVSSSVTAVDEAFDPALSLGPKDGPYGILPEVIFFDRNPGWTSPLLSESEIRNNVEPSDVHVDLPGRNIGFQTEIGSVSFPELGSLRRFLSSEAIISIPRCNLNDEHDDSIHREWSYFKYLPFTEANPHAVDHICQFMYPPNLTHTLDSIESYNWSAQLAQYFQYKALFEGYSIHMFEHYSAVFLWKTSSPSPTLRGALYDWYLATNGGYWGARSGLGNVKVIVNLRDWSIHVVNALPTAITLSSVHWNAYSLNGECLSSEIFDTSEIHIERNSVNRLQQSLKWVGGNKSTLVDDVNLEEIVFYRIEISYKHVNTDISHHTYITSRNSYYLTNPANTDVFQRQSRYSLMGAIRKLFPRVEVDVFCNSRSSGDIECTLINPDKRLAMMSKLSLKVDSPHVGWNSVDNRVLPTHCSDNFITLISEESAFVYISTFAEEIKCSNGYLTLKDDARRLYMVSLDGWNVENCDVHISCDYE